MHALFLLTLWATACFARSSPQYLTVHERRADIQVSRWEQGDRLTPDTGIRMRIALTQSNLDKGHDLLLKISDPDSPSYGLHMSAEEIADYFAPSDATLHAVTNWLTSNGIQHRRLALSANRQWIKFDAYTAEVERLFDAQFYEYQHQRTGEAGIATEQYSIPLHLQEHIDYVSPGIHLRSMIRQKYEAHRRAKGKTRFDRRASQSQFSNCTTKGMTPQCIAAIYNITKPTKNAPGNAMGFYETAGDIYNQKDFDSYTARFYPDIPQGFAPTLIGIDGASTVYNAKHYGDGETALDTQVALPLIYPQNFTIWQVAALPDTNPSVIEYNTWLDAIDGSYCNYTAFGITGDSPDVDPSYPNKAYPKQEQCGVYKPTSVISASYGEAEAAYPVKYLQRQCNEYMKLGLQRTTILFCSQDYGVEGGVGVKNASDHRDCLGDKGNIFAPIWPATCPYVTAVGATTFPRGSNILDPSHETAARFSGGGFSNIFTPASYQQAAIQAYLSRYPPKHPSYSTENGTDIGKHGGVFNRNGRGFPDIACLGTDFIGYSVGNLSPASGTSMSAPLWGAIFNLVNNERLLSKKPTLGFVNPALYKNPQVLRDIMTGSNLGCGYKGIGFNVSKGWDPVTGLGSPDYPSLLSYLKSL